MFFTLVSDLLDCNTGEVSGLEFLLSMVMAFDNVGNVVAVLAWTDAVAKAMDPALILMMWPLSVLWYSTVLGILVDINLAVDRALERRGVISYGPENTELGPGDVNSRMWTLENRAMRFEPYYGDSAKRFGSYHSTTRLDIAWPRTAELVESCDHLIQLIVCLGRFLCCYCCVEECCWNVKNNAHNNGICQDCYQGGKTTARRYADSKAWFLEDVLGLVSLLCLELLCSHFHEECPLGDSMFTTATLVSIIGSILYIIARLANLFGYAKTSRTLRKLEASIDEHLCDLEHAIGAEEKHDDEAHENDDVDADAEDHEVVEKHEDHEHMAGKDEDTGNVMDADPHHTGLQTVAPAREVALLLTHGPSPSLQTQHSQPGPLHQTRGYQMQPDELWVEALVANSGFLGVGEAIRKKTSLCSQLQQRMADALQLIGAMEEGHVQLCGEMKAEVKRLAGCVKALDGFQFHDGHCDAGEARRLYIWVSSETGPRSCESLAECRVNMERLLRSLGPTDVLEAQMLFDELISYVGMSDAFSVVVCRIGMTQLLQRRREKSKRSRLVVEMVRHPDGLWVESQTEVSL